MSSIKSQHICEKILINIKASNKEANIWPSKEPIIDRFITHNVELRFVYDELSDKLKLIDWAIHDFFELVLDIALLFSPSKSISYREMRNRLHEINQKITKKAEELACLLEAREELHNTSGFTSNTHYQICQVIEMAAKDNHLFTFHLKDSLKNLRDQFDLKYWPSLSKCLHELSFDAANARENASDSITAASTKASKASNADFLHALYAAIDENKKYNHGRIPNDFLPSDDAVASIMNCALDFNPENFVDAAYVKRFRQRQREMLSKKLRYL